MRIPFLLFAFLVYTSGLRAQVNAQLGQSQGAPFQITFPDYSAFCWSQTVNAFYEDEIRRLSNQNIPLSQAYLIRKMFEAKASHYLQMNGSISYEPTGMLSDGLRILSDQGLLPEVIYPGNALRGDAQSQLAYLRELQLILEGLLNGMLSEQNLRRSNAWPVAIQKVMDAYFGEVPQRFQFAEKEYTPTSFAKQTLPIKQNDYILLTSQANFPFYQLFTLQLPENWANQPVMNIPLDELMTVVDNALSKGIHILWSGDITEPYFSWEKGIGFVPTTPIYQLNDREKEEYFIAPPVERVVSQTNRQEEYDLLNTTNDYTLSIVSQVKDQDNRDWYLLKNTCDLAGQEENFLYLSQSYIRLKTITIYVHKDGLPEYLRQRLN